MTRHLAHRYPTSTAGCGRRVEGGSTVGAGGVVHGGHPAHRRELLTSDRPSSVSATDPRASLHFGPAEDRKSGVEGKSVSVSVDLGGRRIIKKKKYNK